MKKKNTDGKVPTEFKNLLKNGEHRDIVLESWHDKVMNGPNEIASFTTIVDKKLYHIQPQEGEIFMPFYEYYGDHAECFIIAIREKDNKELFRKNVRTVDMVHWKLSSTLTKTE